MPGFGTSLDAGSIGESFGDYFAVSVGLAADKQYGWPLKAEAACPMDWDSTSYTRAPHCIRRFDTGMTVATRQGEVHADGQIWSQALWEIRLGYQRLGLSHGGVGHLAGAVPVLLHPRHLLRSGRPGDVPHGAQP